jgi:hypothetical protein
MVKRKATESCSEVSNKKYCAHHENPEGINPAEYLFRKTAKILIKKLDDVIEKFKLNSLFAQMLSDFTEVVDFVSGNNKDYGGIYSVIHGEELGEDLSQDEIEDINSALENKESFYISVSSSEENSDNQISSIILSISMQFDHDFFTEDDIENQKKPDSNITFDSVCADLMRINNDLAKLGITSSHN